MLCDERFLTGRKRTPLLAQYSPHQQQLPPDRRTHRRLPFAISSALLYRLYGQLDMGKPRRKPAKPNVGRFIAPRTQQSGRLGHHKRCAECRRRGTGLHRNRIRDRSTTATCTALSEGNTASAQSAVNHSHFQYVHHEKHPFCSPANPVCI